MTGAETRALSARTAGFTLLELLVVLVVLALAAIVALPRPTRLASAVPLRTAAVRLAAEFRAARADAMRTNTARCVTLDLTRRRFWSGDEGKAYALASGLEISGSGRTLEWTGPATARVRFEPDGGSAGAQISLSDGKSKAAVVVDWMTGATRIDWGF
ncbi:MAG: GspH/FimT family pseudopilin [Hyphomicrobium sp.]|jgi:type II secretion system protein H